MHCNFRKHMQIENNFINLTTHALQMLTTQTNKEFHLFLFKISFYFFVLWAFAARVLSNWWSCFLNLQVFFLFAACWALSATIQTSKNNTDNNLLKLFNLFTLGYSIASKLLNIFFNLRYLYKFQHLLKCILILFLKVVNIIYWS